MLWLKELKKTRVYQEAFEEGYREGFKEVLELVHEQAKLEAKLKIVPKLQQRGLSLEEIAELLELDLAIIRASQKEPS